MTNTKVCASREQKWSSVAFDQRRISIRANECVIFIWEPLNDFVRFRYCRTTCASHGLHVRLASMRQWCSFSSMRIAAWLPQCREAVNCESPDLRQVVAAESDQSVIVLLLSFLFAYSGLRTRIDHASRLLHSHHEE